MTRPEGGRRWGAEASDWAHFSLCLGLGSDMLPVVSNPHAPISSGSTLKGLGKTPSKYNSRREAVGIAKWTRHETTDAELVRWSREPDYGICLQCREVRALDVDVPDAAASCEITNFIQGYLGRLLPMRHRADSGKSLLAFRLEGDFSKRSFKTAGGLVEFLATGQQFIAAGTHPDGARYKWVGGLPDDFPVVTAPVFEALWASLVDTFAVDAGKTASVPPRAEGEAQGSSTMDLTTLGLALDAIPNSGADELPYDAWLSVVMALHHETGASAEGLALAHTFSSRASKYSADEVDLEWGRLKGASHGGKTLTGRSILHMARGHGWNDAEASMDDFEVDFFITSDGPDQGGGVAVKAPSFLRKPKSGEIILSMDNVVKGVGFADLVGMRIGLDTFRDEIMFSTDQGVNWAPFRDADYTRLRIALERGGFPPVGREIVRDAVLLVAEHNTFDSAQLWLGGLEWDGVPRVETFLSAYVGVDASPYSRAVGRYLWTALAGRVMEPGCKADMVPVLIGPQGVRKSSAVEALVPSMELFTKMSFADKEDDLSRKMRGRLVAELDELKGLNGRDSEHVKSWLSRTHEDWTPKYREFNTKFPRRLVFIGTANKKEILSDRTGNRRWLPLTVDGVIDTDGIARDRDQVWAEARVLWAQKAARCGRSNGVDYEEAENLADLIHEEYMIHDPWRSMVSTWLATENVLTGEKPSMCDFLQATDVLSLAVGQDAKNSKVHDLMRIGDILREFGYTRKQKRVNGHREWVYFAPLA